jgi:pilus assembly protein CpaF
LYEKTVRAILINGPSSVFVDRDGALQAVPESFRDEAHLLELMDRLIVRPNSGVADLRLRDGSHGVVIFPPVAPTGPVLMLRRAQPGEATLERLVIGGLLDPAVADLLRLGARSRLNMLAVGPSGSTRTALLAAVVRDLDAAVRVVTVAHHRQFRWSAASKVELTTSPETPFSALVEAGARLEPALLVLDSVQREDVPALSGWLRRGGSGMLASLAPDAMSAEVARAADLVVRIDRAGGGAFKVIAVEDSRGDAVFRHDGDRLVRGTTTPSFAAAVQARGHGDALAQLMH